MIYRLLNIIHTMKLALKFGIAYGLAELIHQLWSIRRYNHFNNLRISYGETKDDIRVMARSLLAKNPTLFERARLYAHTSHVRDEDDFCASIATRPEQTPANKLQVGCAKLYWRFTPLGFDVLMKIARQVGNIYVRHWLGFKRAWHKTDDGYYSVWSHVVNNTKPLLFFPGVGLGAIPYAKVAKSFGRTVHIIEVPNIGYATPLSDSQATPQNLHSVVSKHVDDGCDIFAHSLGSIHAAMYMNEIHTIPTQKYKAIICDGCVNPFDIFTSHIYPFVGLGDLSIVRKKPKSWVEFMAFVYFCVYNIEVQSFTKRYHTFYNGTLWRDYQNATIQYVYSRHDILYDTEFIAENTDCTFLQKGGHGSSVFSKARNLRFPATLPC